MSFLASFGRVLRGDSQKPHTQGVRLTQKGSRQKFLGGDRKRQVGQAGKQNAGSGQACVCAGNGVGPRDLPGISCGAKKFYPDPGEL